MTKKYETCHACGNKMYRDSRPSKISYKGETASAQQPGWYCSGCDEILLQGKDAKATEPAFLKLKAKVEGLLMPDEIKTIRKKLGLSQAMAGEILGGGPRAFYKYENGLTLLSRPMNNQLVLLANNPDRLEELQ